MSIIRRHLYQVQLTEKRRTSPSDVPMVLSTRVRYIVRNRLLEDRRTILGSRHRQVIVLRRINIALYQYTKYNFIISDNKYTKMGATTRITDGTKYAARSPCVSPCLGEQGHSYIHSTACLLIRLMNLTFMADPRQCT